MDDRVSHVHKNNERSISLSLTLEGTIYIYVYAGYGKREHNLTISRLVSALAALLVQFSRQPKELDLRVQLSLSRVYIHIYTHRRLACIIPVLKQSAARCPSAVTLTSLLEARVLGDILSLTDNADDVGMRKIGRLLFFFQLGAEVRSALYMWRIFMATRYRNLYSYFAKYELYSVVQWYFIV